MFQPKSFISSLVLSVTYMTMTNLGEMETYSFHVPWVRKVSFAGGGHDECVARQKWTDTAIGTKVQHHHFKHPPAFKEGWLPAPYPDDAVMTVPCHAVSKNSRLCQGPPVFPSWTKSAAFLGRQQALHIRKMRFGFSVCKPPFLSCQHTCWLLSVWLWRESVDLMRGDMSWVSLSYPLQLRFMIL